jgi:hypothetical protein
MPSMGSVPKKLCAKRIVKKIITVALRCGSDRYPRRVQTPFYVHNEKLLWKACEFH